MYETNEYDVVTLMDPADFIAAIVLAEDAQEETARSTEEVA